MGALTSGVETISAISSNPVIAPLQQAAMVLIIPGLLGSAILSGRQCTRIFTCLRHCAERGDLLCCWLVAVLLVGKDQATLESLEPIIRVQISSLTAFDALKTLGVTQL